MPMSIRQFEREKIGLGYELGPNIWLIIVIISDFITSLVGQQQDCKGHLF